MRLSHLLYENETINSIIIKFNQYTDELQILDTYIIKLNFTFSGIKTMHPTVVKTLHNNRIKVIDLLDSIKKNRKHWTDTKFSVLETTSIQVLKKYDDFFEEYKNI